MRNSIVQRTHLLLRISAYTAISKDPFAFQYGVVLTDPRQFDSFLAEKAADSQIARQILELHARCFCDSESPLITPRVESNLHPTQNPEKKDGGRLARSIKISKFSASDFCDESPYIIIIFSGKKYSALSPLGIFNNSQRKLIS